MPGFISKPLLVPLIETEKVSESIVVLAPSIILILVIATLVAATGLPAPSVKLKAVPTTPVSVMLS